MMPFDRVKHAKSWTARNAQGDCSFLVKTYYGIVRYTNLYQKRIVEFSFAYAGRV